MARSRSRKAASRKMCRLETGSKSPNHGRSSKLETLSRGSAAGRQRSRRSFNLVCRSRRSCRSRDTRGITGPLRLRTPGSAEGSDCPIRIVGKRASSSESIRRSSSRSRGGSPSSSMSRSSVEPVASAVPVASKRPGIAIAVRSPRLRMMPSMPGLIRVAADPRVDATMGSGLPANSISRVRRDPAEFRTDSGSSRMTRSPSAWERARPAARRTARESDSESSPRPTTRPSRRSSTPTAEQSGITMFEPSSSNRGKRPRSSHSRTS